ncbi:hypothetical protein [Streptomyces sp. NPDC004528]|uniref:hypothetical protein n=1 Tax=Streptomyces sp. NPDC004528 TaxID=3154550 RepID=UPI0033B3CB7E
MTDFLSIYCPLIWAIGAAATCIAITPSTRRAMDIDYTRSDTDEYVMCAFVIFVLSITWPITLLMWWALPNREPQP